MYQISSFFIYIYTDVSLAKNQVIIFIFYCTFVCFYDSAIFKTTNGKLVCKVVLHFNKRPSESAIMEAILTDLTHL